MYQYITMNFFVDGLKKTLKPLALSGLFFGIGAACKWTSIYAGAGLAVLLFGSSATTTLSLCARRTRVYNNNGELMRGYIYKPFDSFKYGDKLSTEEIVKEENKEVMRVFNSRDASKKLEAARATEDSGVGTKGESNPSAAYARKPTATDRYYRANNLTASPTPGFWVPVQATIKVV
jgi:hypothetical protein